MKKPDYCYKAKVLDSGLCKLERDISLSIFSNYALQTTGEIIKCKYDVETAYNLQSQFISNEDYLEARKINHASYKRTKTLKGRIASMLFRSQCLFLTLTFTNKVLQSTNAETRRKYVRRYLDKFNCRFVANIDYGKKKGREHYHAVIETNNIDYSLWHKYGTIKGELVRVSGENALLTGDYKKISKYINKLTNHAIKATNKRCVLIYSRKRFTL